MTRLVLFCGGPAIYPGGFPKPLQKVDDERTLLDLYLSTRFACDYHNVVLLCEPEFLKAYSDVAEAYCKRIEISICETPSGSSTLRKLETYLAADPTGEEPLVWSYPDIFYFGDFRPDQETNWFEQATITLRPMSSRFPRIVADPYSLRVRSISSHQSKVPANPVLLYAGHLVASPVLLSQVLSYVKQQNIREPASLEFDLFHTMIGRGLVSSHALTGTWLKADGLADIRDILAVMGE